MKPTKGEIRIDAANIGGIEETSVTLSDGVNVLVGRNATNRTSFLQAIMAACGSTDASLKSDAEKGVVELEAGGETYRRTLVRMDGGVTYEGDPYVDEPMVVSLFAFLLESNEARQAVIRQDDLRDLIMRPVDTDRIRAEIKQLESKKRQLDDDLADLADLEDELPTLEAERTRLESRLGEKREALQEKEAEIEALDADVDESKADRSELETKLDELSSTRSDLENVRYDLETHRERRDSVRTQRQEHEEELAQLPETPAGRISEIEGEVDRLRRRKREMEGDINELQNVIQFNEDQLHDDDGDPIAALDDGTDTRDAVTDQLVEENTATCWTCGSTVKIEQIEATIDRLRELSQQKFGSIESIDDELAEFEEDRRTLEQQQKRRNNLERTLERTESELAETKERINQLETKRESLQSTIEELEREVTELESREYEEVLDKHREANQLEFEIERLQNDIDEITDEIASIEARLEERTQLQTKRDEVSSELTELRTRIDRLEDAAVDEFNEQMETVLDLLGYTNIERIWIDRVEREVREGRRNVTKSMFELHVVRSPDSGAVYEDTVDNLSESEREVMGLIFALAGYLTHEVYEECPFMLLDSLEAIDSERIGALVDYFADYAPYLVVALLPEDAANLDADRRIESI